MWWSGKKRHSVKLVRSLSSGGVLDEQTFWQIVHLERERADRSGIPVTVAVFTIQDDAVDVRSLSGWNAAALCSTLRATARQTDHVGIAGENELGVVLWGTRELGAYRFVNRLGEKGERLASACRLFVYPNLDQDKSTDSEPPTQTESHPNNKQILDRIADVERKLAQALAVETAVVKNDDVDEHDDSLGFGFEEVPAQIPTPVSATSGPATSGPARNAQCSTATLNSSESRSLPIGKRKTIVGSAILPPFSRLPVSTGTGTGTGKYRSKLEVQVEPLETLFLCPHPFWKRAVDILGAGLGIVVLSPLFLGLAALIKVTSPGPVLFRQTREGHGGRLFTINKFRTMRIGADAEKAALAAQNQQHGPAFKMEGDPRITRIGQLLRKTCLDELPQLWNVLIGDMTLVGPRPLDHRESNNIARWGRRRMHVMPGLTCIWQVHGKSKVSFNEWMRMDIRYAQKISFWSYIKLVAETIKQILQRKASQ